MQENLQAAKNATSALGLSGIAASPCLPLHKILDPLLYIFIHHNMIESTEQKEHQKSKQKKKKITTMEQVTQIYI